jgi:membrane protease YdiL (CAAX protease family)
MNTKQKFAIVAPLILIVVMYTIFQLLAGIFRENWRIAWYIGLVLYWLIWGAVFPSWVIGRESIRELIKPQKLDTKILLLVLFPLVIASLYRFIPGMEYEKTSVWIFLLLLSTAFGNGFFEEVLWRGVYMKLFHDSTLLRIIWPSIWFALWHYAPGSVSPSKNIIGIIVGAGIFGFYLSYLAKKTNTVWWCIVTHTIGGIIMVG